MFLFFLQSSCEVGFEPFHLLYFDGCQIDDGFHFTAIAAEQDALQQKNNVHKLQEAKVAANKYEDLASQKRQRAQMLMENADLATYKAMMALRIAEAAEADETPERAALLYLE